MVNNVFLNRSNLSKEPISNLQKLARVFIAFFLMLGAVFLYSREKINANDFALGSENQHTAEATLGLNYTAASISDIKFIINQPITTCIDQKPLKKIMWLGNSQLHTINQFQSGQHIAPYWLRQKAQDPSCFWPYGFSLPNANFQEFFILSSYISSATHIDAAVVPLVFDDLREDGLRDDFSLLLAKAFRSELSESKTALDILQRFESGFLSPKEGESINKGLEGFVQQHFEDSLSNSLGRIFPLWHERANLRVNLLTDLYFMRNYILNIKPNTIRKQIPVRYTRNMAALEETVRRLQNHGIPLILYIVPIRQDVTLPYDLVEYSAWKSSIAHLAATYNVELLNLEARVPPELWGSYDKDNIDFMHFQGKGHELVADAIAPALKKILGDF